MAPPLPTPSVLLPLFRYSWVSARPLRIKDSVAGVYAANYRGGDPAPPQGNCDMPNGQCFSGL